MFKKTLSLSLLFLLIFAVKSYAMPYSVNQCANHLSAQSYKAARVWGIRAVNNHPQSFYAHLCLGEADVRLGLYNPAIYNFKHAIPFANDKKKLQIIYNWIGGTFNLVGNEKDALMYDFRSLKLARELNNTNIESEDMGNIAVVYQKEGNYKKAFYYLKKSLALHRTKKSLALHKTKKGDTFRGCFEKCKNNYNLTNSLCGIGSAFESMHNRNMNGLEILNGCNDKAQQDEERCFTNCQIEYQTGN